MSKDKYPPLTSLGNGLAIEALSSLNCDRLEVSANLSIDRPESIHNFAIFANVLETAYNKGVAAANSVKMQRTIIDSER